MVVRSHALDRTRTTFVAPSASLAILSASCGRLPATQARKSSGSAPGRAPVARTSTESFVLDSQPSRPSLLKLRSTAQSTAVWSVSRHVGVGPDERQHGRHVGGYTRRPWRHPRCPPPRLESTETFSWCPWSLNDRGKVIDVGRVKRPDRLRRAPETLDVKGTPSVPSKPRGPRSVWQEITAAAASTVP